MQCSLNLLKSELSRKEAIFVYKFMLVLQHYLPFQKRSCRRSQEWTAGPCLGFVGDQRWSFECKMCANNNLTNCGLNYTLSKAKRALTTPCCESHWQTGPFLFEGLWAGGLGPLRGLAVWGICAASDDICFYLESAGAHVWVLGVTTPNAAITSGTTLDFVSFTVSMFSHAPSSWCCYPQLQITTLLLIISIHYIRLVSQHLLVCLEPYPCSSQQPLVSHRDLGTSTLYQDVPAHYPSHIVVLLSVCSPNFHLISCYQATRFLSFLKRFSCFLFQAFTTVLGQMGIHLNILAYRNQRKQK